MLARMPTSPNLILALLQACIAMKPGLSGFPRGFSVCLLLTLGSLSSVQADSLQALQVRSLAASCAACHGTRGIAEPGMASLAGMSKAAMLQKMRDFQSGKLPATVMQQIANGYSSDQLDALAVYFSQQNK